MRREKMRIFEKWDEMASLTESEEKVIITIWELEKTSDACVTGIMAGVNQKYDRDWKVQTVSTFLARMVKKGCLSAEKKGRGKCYHPTFTLEQYQGYCLMEITENLFQGDAEQMEERWKEIFDCFASRSDRQIKGIV